MAYLRTFSTLGCPELNLEQVVDLAARHGLAGVELRALAGTTDLPAYFAATYGTPEELKARLGAAPVKILALGTSLKLAGGAPADREEFLRFVPWAEALGGPRLRVFDGGADTDLTTLRAMAGTAAWWRGQRARNNWRTDLMVETHDSLLTAEAIKRFLAMSPGTGVLWDSHHTWKLGGEDPLATWRAIRPHVVHVHVKDSISIPGDRHPYSYRLPGDGEFPMRPLHEALCAEFTGPVSLEWERLWHPGLQPLETALAAATQRGWW